MLVYYCTDEESQKVKYFQDRRKGFGGGSDYFNFKQRTCKKKKMNLILLIHQNKSFLLSNIFHGKNH